MRGRKPKPTAVKKLEGNPGKRPLPKNEPQPKALEGCPPCPRHLKYSAREEWNRVVPELVACHILTDLELSMLERYCQAVRTAKEAQTQLDKIGYGNLGDNETRQKVRLLTGIVRTATVEMSSKASDLGITPAARARMGDGGTSTSGGTGTPKTDKPGSEDSTFDFD